MTTDEDRLRAMIAPQPPQPNYPTPWRVAETRRDHVVVTCATGCYTANCPTTTTAEIIVAAVNALATGLTIPNIRAGAETAITTREATPGKPQDGPYPATADEVADELADFITDLDKRGAQSLRRRVIDRLRATTTEPVGTLRCPRCGIGSIWINDGTAVCTNSSPSARGVPGCGASWNSVGNPNGPLP